MDTEGMKLIFIARGGVGVGAGVLEPPCIKRGPVVLREGVYVLVRRTGWRGGGSG